MADVENEIIESSDRKCNYCHSKAVKKFVSCEKCGSVYHKSCVTRKTGVLSTENEKIVICCANDQNEVNHMGIIEEKEKDKEVVLLRKLIRELEEKNELLLDKVEYLEEKLMKYEESEVKHSKIISNKSSYADVLMIKPVKEQANKETLNELAGKIDPAKLKISFSEVKNIKKGGVAITCSDANSKEIIKNKVREEMGDRYKVQESKLKRPRMIIRGIESRYIDYNDEELINVIVQQNGLNEINTDVKCTISVIKKYINKQKNNSANLIMEVSDGSVYNVLKTKETINMGWRKCYITDYYHIVRCFKCAGYNHLAKDCRNEVACFKCSEKHKTEECNKQIAKCINCTRKVNRLNLKMDTNHAAFDPVCPCYQRIIENIAKRTSFENTL